jgi:hypothetical protein
VHAEQADDGEADDRQLPRVEDHAEEADRRLRRELVTVVGGAAEHLQHVLEDERDRDRHHDHGELRRAAAQERLVDQAADRQGQHRARHGPGGHRQPQVPVQADHGQVGDERGYRHVLAEGEIEKVRNPELEGKADRAQREDGRGHQSEAEAEDDLAHSVPRQSPALTGSVAPITQECVSALYVHGA